VFLDGDYSDRPSELPILLVPISEGRADITLGSRLQERRSAVASPCQQVFGNRLAARLIRLLYGLEISDLGPFRAGRADVLRALALEETTYGWAVEMILKGALAGFRVVEVPVSYYPRIGKSKISGTLKGTLGAAWFILAEKRSARVVSGRICLANGSISICAPVVFPWYLLWLLPFLRSASTPLIILWTVSIIPTYVMWHLRTLDLWGSLPGWVMLLEYGCVPAAAAILALHRFTRSAVLQCSADQVE
jgi:hypothetical protein